jgi:hypothetical protein
MNSSRVGSVRMKDNRGEDEKKKEEERRMK